MKRLLLWLVGVALGVVVLLGAVMAVSYAFTTQGSCPAPEVRFGDEALEVNGYCWQVPLLSGQLDKVFASPETLTVQKLGTFYDAHPALALPEWASYATLTIENTAGSVVYTGSAGDYAGFLFPANGEYKASLTVWRLPAGGTVPRFEGGNTGAIRREQPPGKARQAHRLVWLLVSVHPAGQRRGRALGGPGGAGRHCGRGHHGHDRRHGSHRGDRPWQDPVCPEPRRLAGLHPGGLQCLRGRP